MSLIETPQQPAEGPHGEWLTPDGHHTDEKLAIAIGAFLSGQKHSLFGDLGCGHGGYVKILRDMGLEGFGVDGSPLTAQVTDGMCACMNIAKPCILQIDWSICIEVGEHIPAQYQDTVLDNIFSARCGAIVSWAHPGQGGRGHVNCRTLEWVAQQARDRGFHYWHKPTMALRTAAYTHWLKENIIVFGNINNPALP